MKSDGDFVDLGLPSGLLWAKGNIVKNGSKYKIGAETDYGALFSWGNIVPHFASGNSPQNEPFDDGYKFYEEPYASTPGSTIEFTEDGEGFSEYSGYDAARELLGGKCKMPTKDDFVELDNNCRSAWVDNYNGSDVHGCLYTSNINGATLFFPASGSGWGNLNSRGQRGYYWSRSLEDADYAYELYFAFNSYGGSLSSSERFYGSSVRAVTGGGG